ncbi:hypothetical protein ABT034_03065 [Streptomyces sp. NPDC002773]
MTSATDPLTSGDDVREVMDTMRAQAERFGAEGLLLLGETRLSSITLRT